MATEKVVAQGKVIGRLKDRIFTKNVTAKKHLMKKYNAWAVDAKVIEQLQEKCDVVVFMDRDASLKYSVAFVKFRMHGMEEDFGHGLQVFLGVHHFTVEKLGRTK